MDVQHQTDSHTNTRLNGGRVLSTLIARFIIMFVAEIII